MDDDTTPETEDTAPEADTGADKSGPEDPRLAKARKDAAGYRGRLREVEAKLAEFEKAAQEKADADKTEAEKRQAAEARAEAAEQRALRLEVAAEKGLSPSQAKRLVGTTREELEADADELLQAFPAQSAAPDKPRKPKVDPSQGTRGTDQVQGTVSAGADLYAQRHKKPANVT